MTNPPRSPWSKEQIRAARRVALAPLLQARGLALRDRGEGNLEVMEYDGLLLKQSYWRWPDHDLAGNTIDFYLNVLGASFHDAMREILAARKASLSAPAVIALRPQCGYAATLVCLWQKTRCQFGHTT